MKPPLQTPLAALALIVVAVAQPVEAPQQVSHGAIGEMALSHRPLLQSEVESLSEAGAGPADYPRRVAAMEPAAYWRFEDEPGEPALA